MIESIPKELWHQIDFSEWENGEPSGEIRGVIENGEVVAWYLIERGQTHVGPFRVKDDRQGYIGGLLIKDAAKNTPEKGTYIAATTEESAQLCRKMGMIEIAGKLFTR